MNETALTETVDAFHFGAFHVVQPKGMGHRSGMDAMLLASLVNSDRAINVADLGAGAGAAGLAVASRLPNASIVLVERVPEMADFARKTLALEQNAAIAARATVLEADVTLTGKARQAAGLLDDHFDHVIMNPPFNEPKDRATPDPLKAQAHLLTDNLFESWIRTACAITKPGGQISLIARPHSISEIISACGKRFGGLEITSLHPRPGENAVRILVTGIKGSKARLQIRAPLIMHGSEGHKFSSEVDEYNNGRKGYQRFQSAR